MKNLIAIPILFLAGCANMPQNIGQVIGTPQEVQAEVTALAAISKIYVPTSDVPIIHQVGAALAGGAIPNPIPKTGHPKTDAFITSVIAIADLALTKFGVTGALPYQIAIGNGILTNF